MKHTQVSESNAFFSSVGRAFVLLCGDVCSAERICTVDSEGWRGRETCNSRRFMALRWVSFVNELDVDENNVVLTVSVVGKEIRVVQPHAHVHKLFSHVAPSVASGPTRVSFHMLRQDEKKRKIYSGQGEGERKTRQMKITHHVSGLPFRASVRTHAHNCNTHRHISHTCTLTKEQQAHAETR